MYTLSGKECTSVRTDDEVLENAEGIIQHHPESGKHTLEDKKQDFDIILRMLNDDKIMHKQPNRMHRSFQNFTLFIIRDRIQNFTAHPFHYCDKVVFVYAHVFAVCMMICCVFAGCVFWLTCITFDVLCMHGLYFL